MIINHNLMALNASRNMNVNSTNASKSMQKLSSGLRINSAADDAAGLAISEKMRGQIRGLDQASSNAQDGISLVQTAEGALNETTSILQRMRELAVQSASDTNVSVDRGQIQNEVDQLAEELSRIGKTTEFNTQSLLDGSFKGTFQIGANAGQNLNLQIGNTTSWALGTTSTKVAAAEVGTITNDNATFSDGTLNVVTRDVSGTPTYFLVNSAGTDVAKGTDGKTFTSIANADNIVFTDAISSGTVKIDATGSKAYGTTLQDNKGLEAGTYTYDLTNNALKDANGNIVATDVDTAGTFVAMDGTTELFTVSDALANGDTVKVGGVDVSSQTAANSAITTIQSAVESVSTERSKLGAVQNRLEHTINNLGTSSENLTSAESRIRDVDMAKEMSEFSKNNILAQAAQAMLAQANQMPQQVLQLLR